MGKVLSAEEAAYAAMVESEAYKAYQAAGFLAADAKDDTELDDAANAAYDALVESEAYKVWAAMES